MAAHEVGERDELGLVDEGNVTTDAFLEPREVSLRLVVHTPRHDSVATLLEQHVEE